MPRFRQAISFVLCASALFVVSAGAYASNRDDASSGSTTYGICSSWLGHLSYFLIPPRASVQKIQSYATEQENLGKLSARSLALAQGIYFYTGNWRPGIENFFAGIRTQSHIEPRLDWQYQLIEKAKNDGLTIEDLLHFPGLEGSLALWRSLESKGWTLRIVKGRGTGRIHPVKYDMGTKEITVRLALGFHPQSLLLAVTLNYISRWQFVHEDAARKQVVYGKAEALAKKWYSDAHPSALDEIINKYVRYVVAREAILDSISMYDVLASAAPYFEVNGWSYLRNSVDRSNIDNVLSRQFRNRTPEQGRQDLEMAISGMAARTTEERIFGILQFEIYFLEYFFRRTGELDDLVGFRLPE